MYCLSTVSKVNDISKRRVWHRWIRRLASPLISSSTASCRSHAARDHRRTAACGWLPSPSPSLPARPATQNRRCDVPTFVDLPLHRRCSFWPPSPSFAAVSSASWHGPIISGTAGARCVARAEAWGRAAAAKELRQNSSYAARGWVSSAVLQQRNRFRGAQRVNEKRHCTMKYCTPLSVAAPSLLDVLTVLPMLILLLCRSPASSVPHRAMHKIVMISVLFITVCTKVKGIHFNLFLLFDLILRVLQCYLIRYFQMFQFDYTFQVNISIFICNTFQIYIICWWRSFHALNKSIGLIWYSLHSKM